MSQSVSAKVAPVGGPQAGFVKAFEEALESAIVNRRIDARVVYLPSCFGPRMTRQDGHIVTSFAEAILAGNPIVIESDDVQTIRMVFVADAVRSLLMAADCPESGLASVDLAPVNDKSLLEIVENLSQIAGRPLSFTSQNGSVLSASESSTNERNGTRSSADTGSTTLHESLKITIAWLRDGAEAYV